MSVNMYKPIKIQKQIQVEPRRVSAHRQVLSWQLPRPNKLRFLASDRLALRPNLLEAVR